MEKYNLTQTGPEVQEILDGAAMLSDVNAEKERAEAAEQQEAETRAGADATLRGLIDNILLLIPSAASELNQLADKQYVAESITGFQQYVIDEIIAHLPEFKGQFTSFEQLESVDEPKAGDIGIVRTKDTDGNDVFTFYQYKDDQWNEFYSLSYHSQRKPATTGLVGEAPYNGMGRIELPMNWVEGWPNDTWLYYPYHDIVYLMYYWNGQMYAVYNPNTQEGLGLDDNLVVKPLDYNIADIQEFVGERYLPFTESSGVWTITKPDDSTITSTELNNTNIYKVNNPTHLGINVLTQAMINRPNTIYVIQHDYDLNGATITIPDDCILQFEGGSLSDGCIIGSNTQIEAPCSRIFNNIGISGDWNCPVIYSDWFADAQTENCIKNVFNLTSSDIVNDIYISEGTYNVRAYWIGENVIDVKSNTNVNLSGTIKLLGNNFTHYYIFSVVGVHDVHIDGGAIIGDRDEHTGTGGEWGHGINLLDSYNVRISNITINKCWGDSIYIGRLNDLSRNVVIENVKLSNSRRLGIGICAVDNLVIDNAIIDTINGTLPKSGIDIEPNNINEPCTNISIRNCVISNCERSSILMFGVNGLIENVNISNIKSVGNAFVLNTVKHCTISGLNSNSTLALTDCEHIEFDNCVFDSSYLYTSNITKSKIKNSKINYTFHIYDEPTRLANDIAFENVDFYNMTSKALFLKDAKNCSIITNGRVWLYGICENISVIRYVFDYAEGEPVDPYVVHLEKDLRINNLAVKVKSIKDDGTKVEGSLLYYFSLKGAIANNVFIENDFAENPDFEIQYLYLNNNSTLKNTLNNVAFIGTSVVNYLAQLSDENKCAETIFSFMHPKGYERPYITYQMPGTYGFPFFDMSINKPIWYRGGAWVDAEGISTEVKRVGNFFEKPSSSDGIYEGFMFFCTTRRINPEDMSIIAAEGGGMPIYYKGQDTTDPDNPVDIWVDCLGRVVS